MVLQDEIQESAERLKRYYLGNNRKGFGFMSGENPELLKLCIAIGNVWVGFTFAFNKKPTYARVVGFNDVTGRVFIEGGSRNGRWADNFLLKQVKMFRYPMEIYEEWKTSRRSASGTTFG